MLGQENKGLGIFLTALGDGRLAAAAVSLGAAEGAFEKTLAYAKQRVQFNNPLSHFQAIQFYLADMATEIECGRNMIYSAAALGDAGKPYAIEAAMAKLWATDMGQRVTNQCIQIHGGLGYVTDFGIDRYWRDTRVWAIGDGANEIQKIIISRHLLS
jgi:alkylation response protein AidB-like acyl-CoA dehydrogenase